MKIFSDCIDKCATCALCGCDCGCYAGIGDDHYSEATEIQLIARLYDNETPRYDDKKRIVQLLEDEYHVDVKELIVRNKCILCQWMGKCPHVSSIDLATCKSNKNATKEQLYARSKKYDSHSAEYQVILNALEAWYCVKLNYVVGEHGGVERIEPEPMKKATQFSDEERDVIAHLMYSIKEEMDTNAPLHQLCKEMYKHMHEWFKEEEEDV